MSADLSSALRLSSLPTHTSTTATGSSSLNPTQPTASSTTSPRRMLSRRSLLSCRKTGRPSLPWTTFPMSLSEASATRKPVHLITLRRPRSSILFSQSPDTYQEEVQRWPLHRRFLEDAPRMQCLACILVSRPRLAEWWRDRCPRGCP